jgi:LCP family protein required for cell wall assembly
MAAFYVKEKSLGRKIFQAAMAGLFCAGIFALAHVGLERPKTFVVKPNLSKVQVSRPAETKIMGFFFSKAPKTLDHPLNILVLGRSGEGYLAPDLTDSIIILHLTPDAKAALVSVPRDLWVKVPGRSYYSKINALYNLDKEKGPSEKEFGLIKNKITDITGLTIDYYALVDVTALRELVDILGGIDVYVENNINDRVYQHLTLEKGWHRMDGQTVKKYVRTRLDSGGDFARIKRQQQIIGILKDKILGLNPVWDFSKFLEIYRIIGRNIKTDIGLDKIQYFLGIADLFKNKEFKQIVVGPSSGLLRSSSIWTSGGLAYILVPKAGAENYKEIKEYIANHLSQKISL